MSSSRREFNLLIAALAAAANAPAQNEILPAKAFRFEALPETAGATTRIRQMLKGETHSGFLIDLHVTELAAGQMPHAPHRHVHEELVMIREGELEVTIAGRTSRLGAGSAAYLASNVEHGWKNIGTTPARYFVLALGTDKA